MTPEQLADVAESDEHARWIVRTHTEDGTGDGRHRCTVCDSWWPCDLLGLAALAVLRKEERDALYRPSVKLT